MSGLHVVVTTIQRPTHSMREWAGELSGQIPLIVVGDKKGPGDEYDLPYTAFMSWRDQQDLSYDLAKVLPPNTYTRKMLGYLAAIDSRADCVYETDDDNAPLPHWMPREPFPMQYWRIGSNRWTNVYSMFTDANIWPRGFSLEHLGQEMTGDFTPRMGYAPIQQGLVDGSPDVDAIWRLTVGDEPFTFEKGGGPYEVDPRTWCPFNSQSTWWWPEAFSLMYLPVTVSWRVSDIWRSLVAQRCLRETRHGILFHRPEVWQSRNEHDLLTDFREETACYLQADKVARALDETYLPPFVSHRSNVVDCYRTMVREGFVDEEELTYLYAWLDDIKHIMDGRERDVD